MAFGILMWKPHIRGSGDFFVIELEPTRKPFFAVLLAAALLITSFEVLSQVRSGAKAQGTRAITIVSEPAASIFINGLRYGETNEAGTLVLGHTPPGRLTVKVRARGFRDETRIIAPGIGGKIEIPLTSTDDPYDLAFQEGIRLSSIDRKLAAEAYQRAIDIRPKETEARLALARILTEMREYQKAEAAVAAIRKLRPSLAEASAVEGRIFREEGDHERAIAAFERAIKEANGVQPEAAAGLGLLYSDLAEFAAADLDIDAEARFQDLAIEKLTQAKDQLYGAADAIVIYQLLGRALERQGKLEDAIALYERFLQIFADSPEATAFRSFIIQLNIQLDEQR